MSKAFPFSIIKFIGESGNTYWCCLCDSYYSNILDDWRKHVIDNHAQDGLHDMEGFKQYFMNTYPQYPNPFEFNQGRLIDYSSWQPQEECNTVDEQSSKSNDA
jgi:hypothetical protein